MNIQKYEQLAKKVIEIRIFEETILRLFSENKLSGTTHTYIGEEATAVALMEFLTEEDNVFSNHRCHGHYLAYGGNKMQLLAEIMSKKCGLCQGRGGSQHIHYKNFYSNGIQGGIVPNALGMAFADQLKKKLNITVVFLGDGTLGQGIVYETFNLASLLELPIIFIIEDNQYAMSTPSKYAVQGNMAARSKAFGIETDEIESNDLEPLYDQFHQIVSHVREHRKPHCVIIHTYRLAAHSKGDDTRDPKEVEQWRTKDPIKFIEQKLGADFCQIYFEKMEQDMRSILHDLENKELLQLQGARQINPERVELKTIQSLEFISEKEERILPQIRKALNDLLQKNEILLLGEDIKDPYGGAFKVTSGLSTLYKDKVINTPISEAALTGLGVGLAMKGMIPIVEIMFGDFVTLCFDQILNHAAKYGWVYGQEISVPLVLRLPMGGGRGYGPTHSQSLEKFLIGIPLTEVLAINPLLDVEQLYMYAIMTCKVPLIIIENKKMYAEKTYTACNGKINNFYYTEHCGGRFPTIKLSLDKNSVCDVLLLTYGGMSTLAMEAAEELLFEEELQVDIIIFSQLSPLPIQDFQEFVTGKKVVVLEEGTINNGIGAEVVATLSELKKGQQYGRIATPNVPIPNGLELEKQIIPQKETVKTFIRRFCHDQ